MTKTVFPQDPLPKPKVQKRKGATFATLTKVPHDKLRAEGTKNKVLVVGLFFFGDEMNST
jgi:hypothetical protein